MVRKDGSSFRCTMVVYDVPSGTKLKKNPPDIFRKCGFAINLSCWVVPDTKLPKPYIAYLREQGADVRMVRFDEAEEQTILAMAHESLEKQVGVIRKFLGAKIGEAEVILKKAERQHDVNLTNKAIARAKATIRRATFYMNAALEAALAFDILADVEELYQGLGKAIAAKTKAWVIDEVLKEAK